MVAVASALANVSTAMSVPVVPNFTQGSMTSSTTTTSTATPTTPHTTAPTPSHDYYDSPCDPSGTKICERAKAVTVLCTGQFLLKNQAFCIKRARTSERAARAKWQNPFGKFDELLNFSNHARMGMRM